MFGSIPAVGQAVDGQLAGSTVGRERELALLADALDGRGAVVVGEAGVGKSRIARVAGESAAERGVPVEWALATRDASTIPFGALAPVLGARVRIGADRLAVLAETAGVLAARHDGRRALVVLDDAQRLDPASAALVLQLVVGGHVTVLATVRTGELVPESITSLWKDAGAVRIDLGPLEREDAATLAQALLDGPVERRTRDWLFDVAAGNPLYTRELIAAARANGGLTLDRGHWRRTGDTAPGAPLTELIEARIGKLGEQARRALALVALAEPIALDKLARLASPAAIEALERRGLVARSERRDATALRTAHPLHGEVVRTQLGAAEAHRLRAELAAELDPQDRAARLRLATWALDDGHDADAALLGAAAADALAVHDPELAVRLGEVALRAGGGLDAAVTLATALRAAGRAADAEALLAQRESDVAGSDQMPAYLFTRAGALQWGLGRAQDALALVERAEAWSAHPNWRTATRAVAAALLCTSGRLAASIAPAREVLDAERAAPQSRIGAGIALGWALPQLGRIRKGQDALARARALAGPDVETEWPDEAIAGLAAVLAGRGWDAALERLRRRYARARDEGDDTHASFCEVVLCRFASVRGELAEMRRHAENALARLHYIDLRGMAQACLTDIASAAAQQGDVAAARAALARARAAGGVRSAIADASVALEAAPIAAGEGQLEEAQRLALAAAEIAGEAVMAEAEALHMFVRVGGRPRKVRGRLEAIAAHSTPSIADLWARQVIAAAERDGPGLSAVSEAYEEIGARLWSAECASQAAAALAAEGRGDAGRRAQARAARLATACGASTPLLAPLAAASLSPREREVAGLVARGLGNAEIAERLTLSVRTIESHVYRATLKLGLHNRDELAAAVSDRAPAAPKGDPPAAPNGTAPAARDGDPAAARDGDPAAARDGDPAATRDRDAPAAPNGDAPVR